MQFINAVLAVLGFVAVAQASSLTFLNKDVYDYVMCFSTLYSTVILGDLRVGRSRDELGSSTPLTSPELLY
jgi:hypothetical protein